MKYLAVILLLAGTGRGADVSLVLEGDRVQVTADGKPFASVVSADGSKPFLELQSPTGSRITGEGGVFWAHGSINGFDFWSGNGRFQRKNAPQVDQRKRTVTLVFDITDPYGTEIGTLQEKLIFSAPKSGDRMVDLEVTIRSDRGRPIRLGDTADAGLAIRLANEFRTGCSNSEGAAGLEQINGKRSSWVDCTAAVNGESIGIALLDHPDNPKQPGFWIVRPDGLLVLNPFGEQSITGNQDRDGAMNVPTGVSTTFRYRVVIRGARSKPDRLYKDWSRR